MEELIEVVSELKKEQCKLKLSEDIVTQDNIGIKENKFKAYVIKG